MIRTACFLLLLASSTGMTQPLAEDDELSKVFEIGTVQSIIIQQNGEILYEEYKKNVTGNTTTNIKSASKSVLSLLVGIAIDQGYLQGTHQTIGEFIPDYFRENPDSEKESITIHDLLTMRSGLETTSFRNYGRWVLSDDWVRFALDQPMSEEPGGRMVYSTGTSHLLSVILTKATGMSTRDFAEQYLFAPLDIRVGGWDRDPQGYYMGGNNLALSPLALLKIGSIMLNGGRYSGNQLVPEKWIEESLEVYTSSNFNDYDYGYLWWRRDTGGRKLHFAWGNGGQYIIILPGLDAVISITSDVESGNGSRQYQRRIFDYFENTLIPALSS